jgi:hypothetical protein
MHSEESRLAEFSKWEFGKEDGGAIHPTFAFHTNKRRRFTDEEVRSHDDH